MTVTYHADQVRRIVRLVEEVLGPDLVGGYLHGSAVLDGLKPASDIDVLIVTRRSMDDRQRRALLVGLLEHSGFPPALRPVELVAVARSEIRPWRYPPTADFLYGEWLRDGFEAGELPQPEPMPDLALLVTAALAGDRPLTGPAPAEVLEPVPPADIARAMTEEIPGLLADLDGDTRNVVLTLVRIWYTLATNEIASKARAADWALPRLPPRYRPVLSHARSLYLHREYVDERWTDELRAGVHPFADAVLAEIHKVSSGGEQQEATRARL